MIYFTVFLNKDDDDDDDESKDKGVGRVLGEGGLNNLTQAQYLLS